MGLDQSWLIQDEHGGEHRAFHSHRKVPALEAFMASKWKEARQQVRKQMPFLEIDAESPVAVEDDEAVFNCEELLVTSEILAELEAHVRNKTLDSEASGFFWGKHYDEDYADIQEAIIAARALMEQGETILYTSWW